MYQSGQEVLRSQAFAFIVYKNSKTNKNKNLCLSTVCDNCNLINESELEPLKRCTKCKWVYYCNRSCQKKAWKNYHEECIHYPKIFCLNFQTSNPANGVSTGSQ